MFRHRIENKQKGHSSRNLRSLCPHACRIMQVLASQWHFQANRNAELAIPPLLWPVNSIKIGGHVALLGGHTVYSLYCGSVVRSPLLFASHSPSLHDADRV